jgi:cysteine-S-conjugate beta-lyase
LFKIGYSWGGPMSLAVPYGMKGLRQFGWAAGAEGTLVRLSIGLEAKQDLMADLSQALRQAGMA